MQNSKEFPEFLRNLILIRKNHALLFSGSSYELPIQYVAANLTDIDMMYIPTDICALPVNASAPNTFQGKTLIVNTEDTYPGFARLCSSDCQKRYRGLASVNEERRKNGPAWTEQLNNGRHMDFTNIICKHLGSSHDLEISTRLLEMKMDRVFAIYCPYWPSEAVEWKTRERPNGWPPVDVIDKIVASGCYFVAKPHHTNPDDETQWRFSFSQAELILIHSWTDVQKYIYHILRLIKSEVVEACGGSDETIICTYFFKTLMFWECERKPKEFWNDENVENSVQELLCIMIEWLIDGCCPNYFIPECNMISAATERIDFTKEIQRLIYAISGISRVITMWPRTFQAHTLDRVAVVLSERALLYTRFMQVRDNFLNPLFPKTKTYLMERLAEENSLLWFKAGDLYNGVHGHLQFMKACCPKRKFYLKTSTLRHFASSLTEDGDECGKVFLSIGESVYESFQRINSATVCKVRPYKSDGMSKDILYDPLNAKYNNSNNKRTRSHYARCYSRREEGKNDSIERKITSPTTFDYLDAIKAIVQNLGTNAVDTVAIPTRFVSLAYLANFYYTALHDRDKALALCDRVPEFPTGSSKDGKSLLSLFMTNELSPIFDEHFRTVLGLITLLRYISGSLQDNSTILVRICPTQFLKYLKIQCSKVRVEAGEAVVNETFKSRHTFRGCYNTYEPLSEVFMAAVLHASRSKT